MNDLTIRGARAQQNLLEWSQRVAECRSSGQAVTRWCADRGIKPKTYYSWQKKVFAAMIEQQKLQQEQVQEGEPERRFAELPAPVIQNDLVATVRIGAASLDVYSRAGADVAAALCRELTSQQYRSALQWETVRMLHITVLPYPQSKCRSACF